MEMMIIYNKGSISAIIIKGKRKGRLSVRLGDIEREDNGWLGYQQYVMILQIGILDEHC
jgi:hypothetical protein